MTTLDLDSTVKELFNDQGLQPSTRRSYRTGWNHWVRYCASVGLDPYRANVTNATDWIASMTRQGVPVNSIRRWITATRAALEYLAWQGHPVYEPHRLIRLPASQPQTRPAGLHEPLDLDRIVKALNDTRHDQRAHSLLWLTAGAGLGASDLARHRLINGHALTRRGELVPVPAEVTQWPRGTTQNSTSVLAARRLTPYIRTSIKELADWQRTNVGKTVSRFRPSQHPSLAHCAMLRQKMLDIQTRMSALSTNENDHRWLAI